MGGMGGSKWRVKWGRKKGDRGGACQGGLVKLFCHHRAAWQMVGGRPGIGNHAVRKRTHPRYKA